MPKHAIFITTFLFASIINAQTIRLDIGSVPSKPDNGSNIYIAGSFNGWNPKDEKFRFQKSDNGSYYIQLQLGAGKYEYKITRGGWDKVECKKGGAGIPNRLLTIPADTAIRITVEEWADNIPAKPKVSTSSKNVKVIDTAFYIPQLKRKRRVWIYLPQGYASSKSRYPVLYMHDGQNVFEDTTSFSGEWGVDECLDSVKKKCIVVAVDHGNAKRINEYCPYDMERFGKGEGNLYVDFLAKTLKPYIDKRYRTLKDRKNAFVAGSSMGGLISMYAVLKYPSVFGGAGVFSPAFWVGPRIFDDIKKKGKTVNARIYFYGGKQEGESMVPDMLKAFTGMAKVSKSKMTTVIRDGGQHNEARWRVEFPLFYNWLMNEVQK
ncbi:MAG: alpha/beta hydrolase [Chitinophagaceae bacterium]|nr:alpha/beta hydrolase [Chitinophagaceae bacterium]